MSKYPRPDADDEERAEWERGSPITDAGKALIGRIFLALQQEPSDVADLNWLDDIAAIEREAASAAIERMRAALPFHGDLPGDAVMAAATTLTVADALAILDAAVQP